MMCEDRGADLKVIPMNEKGELLMDEFEKLLDETVKIISAYLCFQFSRNHKSDKRNYSKASE